MTKKIALTIALNAIAANAQYVNPAYDDKETTVKSYTGEEVREILTKMVESLSTSRTMSDEAKAKQNELRKAKTAAARSELVAKVAPVIRAAMTAEPMTAKEIFARCEGLPADFSAAKVQNVLLREMAEEVHKAEAKGKANTYHL